MNPPIPAPTPDTTTLVLLCGGQSRRMHGQDKGLLLLRGQALYQQTLQRLAPQMGQVIISANRDLHEYDKSGFKVVRDVLPDHPGPLAGILSALQQLETEWLLTAPCDMPHLPHDLLRRFQQAAQQAPEATAFVAFDGQRQQHLVSLLHRRVEADLRRFLASPQRAVHRWLQQLAATQVDCHDVAEAFMNINTPADLADLERRKS
ncbi:MAG: molybdenum cofactor guanylyltransferase MobA [Gammaproteobacteria bacterium]